VTAALAAEDEYHAEVLRHLRLLGFDIPKESSP
jgi:hypothetical protein